MHGPQVGQDREHAAVALVALRDVQFEQHVPHVRLDRALAEHQPLRDAGVGQAAAISSSTRRSRSESRPSGLPAVACTRVPTTVGSRADPPAATRPAVGRNSSTSSTRSVLLQMGPSVDPDGKLLSASVAALLLAAYTAVAVLLALRLTPKRDVL